MHWEELIMIQITPLTDAIGASITGVDLSQPVPETVQQEIRDAFLEYAVVLFPGQAINQSNSSRRRGFLANKANYTVHENSSPRPMMPCHRGS